MKPLSITLVLFGLLALVQPAHQLDLPGALLGIVVLFCAVTTFRSTQISSFLKIFVGIFSTETIVFGLAVLAGRAGLWPANYAEYLPPESLPLTVAIFSIIVYLVAQSGSVGQITRIADRYFNAEEAGRARVWPFRPFTALKRRIGVAMVVFLVLINQAQVGITVRLSFFNRDLFNAIQNHDAATFWHQLLFVFTPFAFVYVATTVIEFFTQSMLVIRWRRWLTDHFVSRWLARHNHYRISLVAGQTDNPDQRIAEDVYRFINGGSDGSTTAYGIYDFSILLISTISSLVSFAVVLWGLSKSFTLPGTDIIVPGFLFWVALLYAGLGTSDYPPDRTPANRPVFSASAHGSRLPLLARPLARIYRAGGAAERRRRRAKYGWATLRGANRQLSRPRLSTYASDRIYAYLWPDLTDHTLYLHGAVLFRSQN